VWCRIRTAGLALNAQSALSDPEAPFAASIKKKNELDDLKAIEAGCHFAQARIIYLKVHPEETPSCTTESLVCGWGAACAGFIKETYNAHLLRQRARS